MTKCYPNRIRLQPIQRHQVEAQFCGGDITGNGGIALLAADRKLGLTPRRSPGYWAIRAAKPVVRTRCCRCCGNASVAQESLALLVGGGARCLLAAVQFDEWFLRHAGEVRDVWADGLLVAEFVAVQLFVAEVVPEEVFGVGLGLAQGLGFFEDMEGVEALDVFPPPARLRACALVLPTPPQGGSD